MTIELEALDTLFFKDGKPFNRGAETWANGVFPPAPSVWYGAFRSLYLSIHPDELDLVNTKDDKTLALIINGIALGHGSHNYFPTPLDLVKKKYVDNKKYENYIYQLSVHENTSLVTNVSGNELLLYQDAKNEVIRTLENEVIRSFILNNYLSTGSLIKGSDCKAITNFITSEPKIGIGLNKQSNTTREGLLYSLNMLRLDQIVDLNKKSSPLKILLRFEQNLDLPNTGLLKVGGEGKTMAFQSTEFPEIGLPEIENDYFKLYLSTPAIFKTGWLPSWLKNELYEDKDTGFKAEVELISAVVGKPVAIGGFDMAKNRPKPMHQAVPAGSVYYIKSNRAKELVKSLHGKAISETMPQQGFGIAYCGKLNSDAL